MSEEQKTLGLPRDKIDSSNYTHRSNQRRPSKWIDNGLKIAEVDSFFSSLVEMTPQLSLDRKAEFVFRLIKHKEFDVDRIGERLTHAQWTSWTTKNPTTSLHHTRDDPQCSLIQLKCITFRKTVRSSQALVFYMGDQYKKERFIAL
ncbi:hypothetical protein TNCV_3330401 [Trichonephila clavipes]|nr:hypothetical protein TNCV_3330401 [Trichonephila clavipes]